MTVNRALEDAQRAFSPPPRADARPALAFFFGLLCGMFLQALLVTVLP